MPLLARQERGYLATVPETVGHFGAGFGGRDFPSERRRAATSSVSSSPSRPPQARCVNPNPFSIQSSLLRPLTVLRLISLLPIARSAALSVRGTSRRRRWHNGARHFSLSAAGGRLAERGGSPSVHESGSPSAHPPGLVAAPDSLRAPLEGFSRSRSVGIGQLRLYPRGGLSRICLSFRAVRGLGCRGVCGRRVFRPGRSRPDRR